MGKNHSLAAAHMDAYMELKVCCSEAEQLPWTQASIERLSPQTQFGSVLRCAAVVPSLTRVHSMIGTGIRLTCYRILRRVPGCTLRHIRRLVHGL